MLVVDDVHAADNASVAILHSVARKLIDTRVLMILTGRVSELRLSGAPSALTTDLSISQMKCLALEVLHVDSAETLVNQVAASVSKSVPPANRILRASGGDTLPHQHLPLGWAENS